jgi:hypothetical protein
VRFLRHLAAALLTVSIVVALGVAWEHSGAAGLIAPGGGSRLSREIRLSAPGAIRFVRGHIEKGGPGLPGGPEVIRVGGGAPASLANAPTFARLAILEALIIAAAATAERAWYRRRRARRLAAASPAGAGSAGTSQAGR